MIAFRYDTSADNKCNEYHQLWHHNKSCSFLDVLPLCGIPISFCSWISCHSRCKGPPPQCGHPACVSTGPFLLWIAFHRHCKQSHQPFWCNMWCFVASWATSWHRLTCYCRRISFWESEKLLTKWYPKSSSCCPFFLAKNRRCDNASLLLFFYLDYWLCQICCA